MIVTFSIDPHAFSDCEASNEDYAKPPMSQELLLYNEICLEDFYQFWRKYGVLLVPAESGDRQESVLNSLNSYISKAFPGVLQKKRLEKEIRKYGRRGLISAELSDAILSLDGDALVNARSPINVIITSNIRLRALSGEVNRYYIDVGGLYVTTLAAVHHCITHSNKCNYIVNPYIDKKDTEEDIWRKFFNDLALYTETISIVDGYCGQRLVDNQNKKRGIEFFLERLDAAAKIRKISNGGAGMGVSVFLMHDDKAGPETIENAFSSLASKLHWIDKLIIFVAGKKAFSEVFHDRYVRFKSTAVEIGSGLEIMDNGAAWRCSTISMNSGDPTKSERENHLRNLCRAQPKDRDKDCFEYKII